MPPAPPPFDRLSESDLHRVLSASLRPGTSLAEIFIERRSIRHFRREERKIRAATSSLETGAGVRVIAGEGTGYAFTTEPAVEALLRSATAASKAAAASQAAAASTGAGSSALSTSGSGTDDGGASFRIAGPQASAAAREGAMAEIEPASIVSRTSYLERLDEIVRGSDPRVTEVSLSLTEESRSVLVINSEGRQVHDLRRLTTIAATVYVRQGSITRKGRFGGGGRETFESLAAGRLGERIVAAEALRRAVVQIDAVEAPAGEMPVVIGNGWGGVLLHEAIGHGFEADFVRRGSSIFTGRLGRRVASEICTVADDATVPGLRGSFDVDDEGTPGLRTPLIENGVLTGYLHDLISARALGARPTGNGRRQSFRHPPIPRQSNILLERGDSSPEEIIRSVDRGLYARAIGGGMVDIVNGNFAFEVTEGYLIEDGRVTASVRGANLVGTGQDVLTRITRVGSDFEFDPGVGVCGKDGQSAPVGVGQPTVLVSAMTVGGTKV